MRMSKKWSKCNFDALHDLVDFSLTLLPSHSVSSLPTEYSYLSMHQGANPGTEQALGRQKEVLGGTKS